ncbi:hypothetical protein NEMIN01_1026 [Nematocida minor]|uniref:uncharacterized protein n=1 Tax=Nematocida minor TaxID=1912983 RepID=UPI00221F6AF0|nr:uncharacterized protein NEMIN01_1026 [Nematocida minor]KAI5190402.1 hypothetical protein NEMIN01_1026 [Nematocida minor]
MVQILAVFSLLLVAVEASVERRRSLYSEKDEDLLMEFIFDMNRHNILENKEYARRINDKVVDCSSFNDVMNSLQDPDSYATLIVDMGKILLKKKKVGEFVLLASPKSMASINPQKYTFIRKEAHRRGIARRLNWPYRPRATNANARNSAGMPYEKTLPSKSTCELYNGAGNPSFPFYMLRGKDTPSLNTYYDLSGENRNIKDMFIVYFGSVNSRNYNYFINYWHMDSNDFFKSVRDEKTKRRYMYKNICAWEHPFILRNVLDPDIDDTVEIEFRPRNRENFVRLKYNINDRVVHMAIHAICGVCFPTSYIKKDDCILPPEISSVSKVYEFVNFLDLNIEQPESAMPKPVFPHKIKEIDGENVSYDSLKSLTSKKFVEEQCINAFKDRNTFVFLNAKFTANGRNIILLKHTEHSENTKFFECLSRYTSKNYIYCKESDLNIRTACTEAIVIIPRRFSTPRANYSIFAKEELFRLAEVDRSSLTIWNDSIYSDIAWVRIGKSLLTEELLDSLKYSPIIDLTTEIKGKLELKSIDEVDSVVVPYDVKSNNFECLLFYLIRN